MGRKRQSRGPRVTVATATKRASGYLCLYEMNQMTLHRVLQLGWSDECKKQVVVIAQTAQTLSLATRYAACQCNQLKKGVPRTLLPCALGRQDGQEMYFRRGRRASRATRQTARGLRDETSSTRLLRRTRGCHDCRSAAV